jgi:hypothetical protein
MFRYYNMDVAMQSGIEAAERAIGRGQAPDVAERGELVTTRLI